MEVALLASVFVIAACGLVYELAAGALASYVLGDSVLQFSTIIGTYLFAMGVGSWLSRFIDRQLPAHFLRIELLIALIGGLMPAALFLLHAHQPQAFREVLYGLVLLIGALVGLEIPLVMRLLKRNVALKDLVSQVLTFDYLGALAVSLAFPLLLLPQLGLVRTGLLFGLLNSAVALWALWLFRHELRGLRWHVGAAVATTAVLVLAFVQADRITTWAEDRFYQDKVVYAESSPWQRVVVTHGREGHKLYLNGNLQFAERDEYRYHEALVHPAAAAFNTAGTGPRRVAVLGGGDGLAVREILRYPAVESVVLVELDPHMTRLFSTHAALKRLNANALLSPKVQVVNADAFTWLERSEEMFDLIVVDFPDPTNFSIGKLYTDSFYRLLAARLSATGFAVVQSTSPLVARQSYWTVVRTMESVGLQTVPYHALVPSFGEWGFIIAGHRPWRAPTALPQGLRYASAPVITAMTQFPPDMARLDTEINRLYNQVLVTTFEREWGQVRR
jgi:spermidine synthase